MQDKTFEEILKTSLVEERLNLIKEHSMTTYEHSLNVGHICYEMYPYIENPVMTREELTVGALLHDYGKLILPVELLENKSEINHFEYLFIRWHPEIGYRSLMNDFNEKILEIIYAHHEKLDGAGYPRKLKGKDISKEVRLVTVVDIYEALRANRCYSAPKTYEDTLKILNKGVKENKLDADAVNALKKWHKENKIRGNCA